MVTSLSNILKVTGWENAFTEREIPPILMVSLPSASTPRRSAYGFIGRRVMSAPESIRNLISRYPTEVLVGREIIGSGIERSWYFFFAYGNVIVVDFLNMKIRLLL